MSQRVSGFMTIMLDAHFRGLTHSVYCSLLYVEMASEAGDRAGVGMTGASKRDEMGAR
jgi:hypothetical protein